MATINTDLYDALRSAGFSEENARRTASAVASQDARLAKVETQLAVHTALFGVVIAIGLAVFWQIWSLNGIIADLRVESALTSQRLGIIEQRLTGVEQRLTGVEQRLTGVEQRITGLEQRTTDVEQRLTLIERRLGPSQP